MKGRVDPLLVCFLACVQWIPQIHLWCHSCWPIGGQNDLLIDSHSIFLNKKISYTYALEHYDLDMRINVSVQELLGYSLGLLNRNITKLKEKPFCGVCYQHCQRRHKYLVDFPFERSQFVTSLSPQHWQSLGVNGHLNRQLDTNDSITSFCLCAGNSDPKLINFYHPQTKLRKGNVFTSVCQEFCPQGGVHLSPTRQTSP